MATLLDEIDAHDIAQAEASAKAKHDAATEYKAITHRHASPKPGDAEAIRRILALLQLTAADFRADCAAFAMEKKLVASLKTEDAITAHRAECDQAMKEAHAMAVEAITKMVASLTFDAIAEKVHPWLAGTWGNMIETVNIADASGQHRAAKQYRESAADHNYHVARSLETLHRDHPRIFAK